MIKTKILSKEKSCVTAEIMVTEDTIIDAMKTSINKLNSKHVFPGFRKGKAPKVMIEKILGKDVVFEEAFDIIIKKAYAQIIQEHQLKALGGIDISGLDEVDLESAKEVTFKISVTVEPEINLPDFSDWKFDREDEPITDKLVDEQINFIREDMAQFIPTDRREVINGDFVIADFAGYINGEQFPGGTAKESPIYIGSNKFIPGFEEQIIGAVIDEEKEINVTFPLDYPQSDLVGQEAVFKILVKDIKEKKLPELNDEFAKDVADISTYEEFRERIRHNMTHRMQNMSVRNLGVKVLNKLIEETELEVPDLFIDQEVQDDLERLKSRVLDQGMTWQDYLAAIKKTEEELNETLKNNAEPLIKRDLIVDALVEKEQIKIYVQEVEHVAAHMLDDYNFKSDALKEKALKNKDLQREAARKVTEEKVLIYLGEKCDLNPIPECETCKAEAQHQHSDSCGCGEHEHDENCTCQDKE